jgi:hypothetical protein
MTFPPWLGVTQYVAVYRNRWGQRFAVFRTGDDRYYLFSALLGESSMHGDVAFPVEKARLRDDLRRALAHRHGNSL